MPEVEEGENRGCPDACGLCGEHRQDTCCVLYEVTERCNLNCAFCFANGGAERAESIRLQTVCSDISALAKLGETLLQLSGGEPTLRDDLPRIVAYAKAAGCKYVQLNTNGLRLADDESYLAELAEAGLSFVFMQFDGTDEAIHVQLRGEPLLERKLRAVRNCDRYGVGVTLVPTLVPGVNTNDVGNLIKLAVSLSPAVRGVHFQPVSYFGRYPEPPGDDDRYTLDELLAAVVEQTAGLIDEEHLVPSHCDHPLCGFHASFIVESDGSLTPLSRNDNEACCCTTSADQNREYIARRWQRRGEKENKNAWGEGGDAPFRGLGRSPEDLPDDDFSRFLRRAATNAFTVTAMAFQDAETLDIERLRRCSLHVYANGRLVPFCARYLTLRKAIR